MATYPPVYFREGGYAIVADGGGGGGSDWDVSISKSADQDVTNNQTHQNDSELAFPVTAGDVWLVELYLIYSGNDTTGDYKGRFTYPASSNGISSRWAGSDGGSNAAVDSAAVKLNTGALGLSMGVTADINTKCVSFVSFMISITVDGTMQWQFANNAAGVGRISRTCKGSLLRAKRLASA